MRFVPGRGLWLALVTTTLAVILMYLASTWGIAAWSQARAAGEGGAAALPVVVANAPPSLGTTDEYGPLGAVSMVYAGTDVEDGLVGEVERPWIAIAAQGGAYRAISAPELPEGRTGGVAVAPEGDLLAWATGDGVEVHDPVTGRSREIPLDGATHVGTFSPDGSMVVAHAGGLRVLDLATGDVVAEGEGTDEVVVGRAAWRPDGSAVDYVDGSALVTLSTDGGDPTTQPSPFDETAPLAWAPNADQLVAMQEDADGVLRLVSARADGDGGLGPAGTIDTSGISLAGLLGFSGEETVAVSAYLLESGSVERVLDIPLDGGSPADVTTLPPPGDNWVGSDTLAVSSAALRAGSSDFGNPVSPWSYRARLVSCLLVGLFGLGLWLTRRRPGWAIRRR